MADENCVMCNGSDTKLCGSCQSISYCSQTCQKADWPLHKKICKSFTTIPTRPSYLHRLSILLPVDSKDPQLVWVKCTRHKNDDDGISWESPETQSLLDSENLNTRHGDRRESRKIRRSNVREFNLSHTVEIIVRETGLVDGSKSNACVQNITKGQMIHDWSGPIVVMRQPGTAIDPLVYEDIRPGDLRVAVDNFLSY
jgi:hypothetical protein